MNTISGWSAPFMVPVTTEAQIEDGLCVLSGGNGFLSDHNGGNTLPTDWRAGDHNKIYFKLMTI